MVNRKVLQLVRMFSRRLIEQRAEAIVLFGSWVRGDAYRESDIDIQAIGRGPHYMLQRYNGHLISVAWATSKQHLKAFKDPNQVCGVIPAWRNALIIYDPRGIAKKLKQKASLWKWDSLDKREDKWAADELTGYAEEVHRLIGNLQQGRRSAASVVRSILAIRLAQILAVRHHIFYDSENRLWDLVSEKMGAEWARLQSIALGEGEESFEDTCEASLRLFALTAQDVEFLLSPRQLEVVAHACEIAGQPLPKRKQGTLPNS